jgi:hypothetical protein
MPRVHHNAYMMYGYLITLTTGGVRYKLRRWLLRNYPQTYIISSVMIPTGFCLQMLYPDPFFAKTHQ